MGQNKPRHPVVHLNSAGASLMPETVVTEIRRHLQREVMQGGYEAELECVAALSATRNASADLLGCHVNEVGFADSASTAWTTIVGGILGRIGKGDQIVTTVSSYSGHFVMFLRMIREMGAEIVILPDIYDEHDFLSRISSAINKRVKILALTHIPTFHGRALPLQGIASLLIGSNCFFILDAAQSLGQLPINVKQIGCSALVASGRKYLRGPRGTAVFYISQSWITEIEPVSAHSYGGHFDDQEFVLARDARRCEGEEFNVSARLGLGAAIDITLNLGAFVIAARIGELVTALRLSVAAMEGIHICEPAESPTTGIITLHFSNHSAEAICLALRERGFNVWPVAAVAPAFVTKAADFYPVLRVSVHYFNTLEELDRFSVCLNNLLHS